MSGPAVSGMANLVRYYMRHGVAVAGYDRTPSQLTDELKREGALPYPSRPTRQRFQPDSGTLQETLVVYTPAVPESNPILQYFRDNGFEVVKEPNCWDASPATPTPSAWPDRTERPPQAP